MAFGFVIERFGLFLHTLQTPATFERGLSFWIGLLFILLGSATTVHASLQYLRVLKTLRPVEIPAGYAARSAVAINVIVGVLGIALAGYVLIGARS